MGEVRGVYLDLPYHVFLDDHHPKGTHIIIQYDAEKLEFDAAGKPVPSWTYTDESNETWFLFGGKPMILLNSEEGESLDSFVDRFLDQTKELHEDTFVYTTGGPSMIATNIWNQRGAKDPLEIKRVIKHFKDQGVLANESRIEEFIEDLKRETHPALYGENFNVEYFLQ